MRVNSNNDANPKVNKFKIDMTRHPQITLGPEMLSTRSFGHSRERMALGNESQHAKIAV